MIKEAILFSNLTEQGIEFKPDTKQNKKKVLLSKATDVEREEKRRRIKNISGFELKIDFGFNIKEIALPLSTSSYRDSIIKQNLQCKIKYFF